jgi:hypothetical protein
VEVRPGEAEIHLAELLPSEGSRPADVAQYAHRLLQAHAVELLLTLGKADFFPAPAEALNEMRLCICPSATVALRGRRSLVGPQNGGPDLSSLSISLLRLFSS